MSIDIFQRLYHAKPATSMTVGETITDYHQLFTLPAGSIVATETGEEYFRVEGGWMNRNSNISISSHGMIRRHKVYLKHVASE